MYMYDIKDCVAVPDAMKSTIGLDYIGRLTPYDVGRCAISRHSFYCVGMSLISYSEPFFTAFHRKILSWKIKSFLVGQNLVKVT